MDLWSISHLYQLANPKSDLVISQKGILLREHLFKEHHGTNLAPKNRTYYYSLNYQGLAEYAQQYKIAESQNSLSFMSPTKQFGESSENPFCDKPQNKTDHTSIEDNSRDQSLPTPPQGRVGRDWSLELSSMEVWFVLFCGLSQNGFSELSPNCFVSLTKRMFSGVSA